MRFLIFCLSVLSLSSATQAQSMKAFTKFGEGFTTKKDSEIVVENMPRVMSQDTLGLCYSFAATAVMQANNCRIMKQDCKSLPESEMFSPLDVARFGQDPDGETEYESSYRGINDGGPGAFTLQIAANFIGNSASEACMSLDKLLGKMDGAKFGTETQAEAFESLKTLYKKSKKIEASCEKCKADFIEEAKKSIDQDFCVKKDQVALLKAFNEETYEKFFDRLVTPSECARAKNRAYFEGKDSTEIKLFPEEKKDLNYKSVMKKLKSTLEKKLPVLLQNICLDEKKPKKQDDCQNKHATVISGYARKCDGAGNCYDAVKIHNSWGEAWQKAYNGGWVAADELFKHIYIEKETLSWLEDIPK
ncbi:hypothetical protein [Bdellovibrio sp. HCB288]|uniref:hypothetical protein n=1 Tax=Bdellovibrio sp. HCB288 TaxID=3394355 RepID=UPI0039B5AB4D